VTGASLHIWPALGSAARRPGRWILALTIAAPAVTFTAATPPASAAAASAGPAAHPARGAQAALGAIPAPPPGWSTVFKDNFNAAAGSRAGSKWKYDTGPGSSFGTGEIETMTSSTRNVHRDGHGHLDITALGSGGSWTSGRIQATSANVRAPAGGKLKVTASIKQPAGGPGYWPAFWMLGPASGPRTARSTSWRTSTRCPGYLAPSTAAPTPAARATRETASAAA